MALANGFRNCAPRSRILVASPICIFAINHIIRPAGAATDIALPNTNSVLSNIERIIIIPNFGFL